MISSKSTVFSMARSDGLERIPDGVATPETRRIYPCHFWGRGFNARQSENAKAETRRLRPAARRDIRDARCLRPRPGLIETHLMRHRPRISIGAQGLLGSRCGN